jgi:hypothetical protein
MLHAPLTDKDIIEIKPRWCLGDSHVTTLADPSMRGVSRGFHARARVVAVGNQNDILGIRRKIERPHSGRGQGCPGCMTRRLHCRKTRLDSFAYQK